MVLNGIIFIYVYFLNVTFILFFKVLQRAIKELLDKGITKNQTLARGKETRDTNRRYNFPNPNIRSIRLPE